MGRTKILMVCLGNICRSPLAEGILKSKLPESHFEVSSAGTASYHTGNAPDKRSIQIAAKYGIDISYQRAQKLTLKLIKEADHIYVMDLANLEEVKSICNFSNDQISKVKLVLQAAEMTELEVPDPYYGEMDGFEKVFNLLDKATDIIANQLLKKSIP